jgi:osmotically-inducible protein OsmY
MKTDLELQGDVLAELRREPKVDGENIATAVHDGVVTLRGHVSTYAQKLSAECAVARVAGVKAIANDLDLEILGGNVRSHAERKDMEMAAWAAPGTARVTDLTSSTST